MITLHQEMYIAVIGHGDPPEFDDLVTAVEESVGRPIDINGVASCKLHVASSLAEITCNLQLATCNQKAKCQFMTFGSIYEF